MSSRLRPALAALALAACAGRHVEPVIDLTPWVWTWSQAALGGYAIRYGFPDEPLEAQGAGEAATLALAPLDAGMLRSDAPRRDPQARDGLTRATRFASYRYDCAREDRAEEAVCTVDLDFWLLELEPPLAAATLPAYQERFESVYADPPSPANALVRDFTRDARGHEWLHRALVLESGATFSHYSRPLDARHALAVTAYTSRAPDRVVAYDLARDAIGRVRIEAAP